MSTQIQIEASSATIVLNIAALDAVLLAPPVDRDRNGRMSREEFDLGKMMLEQGVPLMLKFTTDAIPLLPQSSQAEVKSTEGFTNEPHTIEFTMTYSAPPGMQFGRVRIDPNLFRSFISSPVDGSAIVGTQRNTVTILDRGNHVTLQATGHQVYDSGAVAEAAVVTADRPTTVATMTTLTIAHVGSDTGAISSTATAGTSTWALMLDYLLEGIWHILIGWDHVFFVVGIILIAPNFKNLIKVITAFTIAHSITLILTSLEVLKISRPQIVEAIIAASVAYVGLENLVLRNRQIPWRWALVFGFGLIHGLGFAGVLRELLGAGGATAGSKGQLVACLLTFNVGVEIGQLLILCLLWPSLQALRKYSPRWAKYVLVGASSVILVMGMSFLVDRTVAPGRLPWVEWFNG
ncbi:MAG: HupE/UreJ family protein [Candidatus Sumerlaeaceae bacterium]